MSMIKETRKIYLKHTDDFCSIAELKEMAGEFFDSSSIRYEWSVGLILAWERPETQAEMDERVARTAKTKGNVKRNMLEQVAAIEKRIEKEQHKLKKKKKTLAEHYSDC